MGAVLGSGTKCSHGLTLVAQARKKSTKIKFLSPEIAGCGGDLPREGVGVKKSDPPSKVHFPWVLREGTWDLSGVRTRFRDRETTITLELVFLSGLGIKGREETCPQKVVFFWWETSRQ